MRGCGPGPPAAALHTIPVRQCQQPATIIKQNIALPVVTGVIIPRCAAQPLVKTSSPVFPGLGRVRRVMTSVGSSVTLCHLVWGGGGNSLETLLSDQECLCAAQQHCSATPPPLCLLLPYFHARTGAGRTAISGSSSEPRQSCCCCCCSLPSPALPSSPRPPSPPARQPLHNINTIRSPSKHRDQLQ